MIWSKNIAIYKPVMVDDRNHKRFFIGFIFFPNQFLSITQSVSIDL